MGIALSLRQQAEQAAKAALNKNRDVIQIGNEPLVLVRTESPEGKKRETQNGSIAEEITLNKVKFYICNW